MTVLDILASTEIHSLARGCAFSYRLSHIILWGYGGAYHKDSKYLCSSFAVKAGGGLHSKGAYFRVSTVLIYVLNYKPEYMQY